MATGTYSVLRHAAFPELHCCLYYVKNNHLVQHKYGFFSLLGLVCQFGRIGYLDILTQFPGSNSCMAQVGDLCVEFFRQNACKACLM